MTFWSSPVLGNLFITEIVLELLVNIGLLATLVTWDTFLENDCLLESPWLEWLFSLDIVDFERSGFFPIS